MDYFKFDAAAGDMLKLTVKSVSVDANSTLDPYVMILMPDGKTILEKTTTPAQAWNPRSASTPPSPERTPPS